MVDATQLKPGDALLFALTDPGRPDGNLLKAVEFVRAEERPRGVKLMCKSVGLAGAPLVLGYAPEELFLAADAASAYRALAEANKTVPHLLLAQAREWDARIRRRGEGLPRGPGVPPCPERV